MSDGVGPTRARCFPAGVGRSPNLAGPVWPSPVAGSVARHQPRMELHAVCQNLANPSIGDFQRPAREKPTTAGVTLCTIAAGLGGSQPNAGTCGRLLGDANVSLHCI